MRPQRVAYAANGRNQYTTVVGATFGYDLNGNLTSTGARTYGYDAENRLTSVAGSANLTLTYDPLGRLWQTTAGTTTTDFLYEGDRLIAEYNGATLQKRYAHGPGVDEPIVWYEGATLTTKRWLHPDERGSIVAWTDGAAAATVYRYGAYGEPAGGDFSGSRFRYTGQVALPEVGLYHYKARVYDPGIGRFLQTDPLGYEGDFNLYTYVENDPLNRNDPFGLQSCPKGQICPDVPKPARADRDVMAQAVGPAKRFGGSERGGHMIKNPKTGERKIITGRKAGREDSGEFRHKVPSRAAETETSRLEMISHTHNASETKGVDRSRETRSNNAPSIDDQSAMNQRGVAVQVIGPDVTGTLFRENSQDYFAVESGKIESVPDLTSQQINIIDERAPQ